MEPFIEQTVVSQLTTHLREQIGKGELKGTMPGIGQLVRELGGGTDTVIAAIANLEREGIIVNQGAGRRRKIVKTPSDERTTGLRVQITCFMRKALPRTPVKGLERPFSLFPRQIIRPNDMFEALQYRSLDRTLFVQRSLPWIPSHMPQCKLRPIGRPMRIQKRLIPSDRMRRSEN